MNLLVNQSALNFLACSLVFCCIIASIDLAIISPTIIYNRNGISMVHSFLGHHHHNMDEMRYMNNTVKCGLTKVQYLKNRFVYNWEIKGFLSYLDYVYDFGQTFALESENVSFSSVDGFDGIWKFRLEATSSANESIVEASDSESPLKSSNGNILKLIGSYIFDETILNQQISVGLQLDLIIPNTKNNGNSSTVKTSWASKPYFVGKPTRKSTRRTKHKTMTRLKIKKTKASPTSSSSTNSPGTPGAGISDVKTTTVSPPMLLFQGQRRRIFPSWFLKPLSDLTSTATTDASSTTVAVDHFADDDFFADIIAIENSYKQQTSTTTTKRPILTEIVLEGEDDDDNETYETVQHEYEFEIPNILPCIDKLKTNAGRGSTPDKTIEDDLHLMFSIFIVYPYEPITFRSGSGQIPCTIYQNLEDNQRITNKDKNNSNENSVSGNISSSETNSLSNQEEIGHMNTFPMNSQGQNSSVTLMLSAMIKGQSNTSSTEVTEEAQNLTCEDAKMSQFPPFVAQVQNSFNFTESFFEYSDMELIVESVHIPAHRVILANSSPILAEIIQNASVVPSHQNVSTLAVASLLIPSIQIDPRIALPAIQLLIQYLYTGKYNATKLETELVLVEQLLLSSHLFGLQNLKMDCERILVQHHVNSKNPIRLYNLSKVVNSVELAKKTISVMRENKHTIVAEEPEEFQKLLTKYPTLIFELFMTN